MLEALGSYEIYKTGFFIIIMCSCFCCAVALTYQTIKANYVSVPGNITLNADNLTETLTYTVNSKQYTKTIKPVTTTNNNITTTNRAFNVGSYTVYYPSADPDSYSIGVNPTYMSGIFAAVTCFLLICMILWFIFLRSNPGVAGVFCGIDAAETVGNSIFSR
jgi:hypothetical protein